MVVWTNWRSVLLASGAGGRLPGSVNCGPQPQVVTQWPSAARASTYPPARIPAMPIASRLFIPGNFRFVFIGLVKSSLRCTMFILGEPVASLGLLHQPVESRAHTDWQRRGHRPLAADDLRCLKRA